MSDSREISRRDLTGLGFRLGALALIPGLAAACASPPLPAEEAAGPSLRIAFQPARIFKTADLPRERTEAWFASAFVESNQPITPTVEMVEVSHFAKGQEVSVLRHTADAARSIVVASPPRPSDAPTNTQLILGLRLPCRERAALAVDETRVLIRIRDEGGRLIEARGSFAVETYTQKTDLIFPFRGTGIVTQGGAANGGHRNRSGQFAVDAMGLSSNYAVQTGEAFAVNTDLSGFGRTLIAPAAGVVVIARGDRPDQPVPGVSDEAFHVPEHRGSGDPGNHVVIDHGNGEFSMVAHLKAGSLLLNAGQRVAQGDTLGQLGNSGDSFAPHVHYQLQDGPDWQTASGLPCRFTNVQANPLVRGEFFLAR